MKLVHRATLNGPCECEVKLYDVLSSWLGSGPSGGVVGLLIHLFIVSVDLHCPLSKLSLAVTLYIQYSIVISLWDGETVIHVHDVFKLEGSGKQLSTSMMFSSWRDQGNSYPHP